MFLRYQYLLRNLFLTYDLIVLNLSYFLSVLLLHWQHPERYVLVFKLPVIFLINVVWLSLSYSIRFYLKPYEFVQFTRNAIRLILIHFALLITSYFFLKQSDYSRLQTIIQYGILTVFTLSGRYLFYYLQKKYNLIQYDKRKVVIMGNGEMALIAAHNFCRKDSGYEFAGFFVEPKSRPLVQDFPVLGTPEEAISFAKKNGIHEIFTTIFPDSPDTLHDLITEADAHMIRVKFIPDYQLIFKRSVTLSVHQDLPIISFREEPLEKMDKRLKKRLFDICFTLILTILIFWWLIPLLALLVKLSSKGPVFFSQKRSGRNGEEFVCYKFRSMYMNKDADTKAAEKGDKRITPLGAFMRKTNLDELPQFINVLKGDMSIVGPRPHMLNHTEEYRKIVDKFMVRHLLKPGITGWAQIHGLRGNISDKMMQKRVEYDIWYLENWSFLLDIKIIIKTVLNIFKGQENAY